MNRREGRAQFYLIVSVKALTNNYTGVAPKGRV